jgi:hypothetical protein
MALSLGLATVILGADWTILKRDWLPIIWHLKHGRHVEMKGVRFTVPLLFQEDHGTSANSLEFFQFPGHFNKKTAAITILFNKPNAAPAFSDTFSREERTAYLSEKPGNCVDYVSQERRYVTANNLSFSFLAPSAPTYIYCDFGDGLSANFSGSLDARDDFYAFLANAKVVKRKD